MVFIEIIYCSTTSLGTRGLKEKLTRSVNARLGFAHVDGYLGFNNNSKSPISRIPKLE